MTSRWQHLIEAAQACFSEREPSRKVELTREAAACWRTGELSVPDRFPGPLAEPGRPERPLLVSPRELPRRDPSTREGLATLIHALTHIEFNAINLAWDAVQRFPGMPTEYYGDWLRVADEEAHHFELLRRHLASLGFRYGDFPGHDGLWEMARDTAGDILVRMALIPRCLEARGLDVSPGIRRKLEQAGDEEGAALLDIILRDEIGHVAIGDRWFRYLCSERGLEPEGSWQELVHKYLKGPLKGPFHLEARRAAGFSEAELRYLEGIG